MVSTKLMFGAAVLVAGALAVVPAAVSAAESVAADGSDADIAFQDSNHNLQTVTSDRVRHSVGLGMAAGSSPSIVKVSANDIYWTAMRANTGVLWTVDPQLRGRPENAVLAPGTSPSIDKSVDGSTVRVFYQNSAGRRAHLSGPGGRDLDDGSLLMAPGTSPALKGDIQSDHGLLRTWPDNPLLGGMGMAPGTSPSSASHIVIAFTDGSNFSSCAKAWQGSDHLLRFAISDDCANYVVLNPALGMMPGTSPSIALGTDGQYEIGFQANNGILWTVTPDSHGNPFGQPTNLGMDQASSPSITARATGGYQIAFQANTHQLWTVDGAGFGSAGFGRPVDGAAMAPGTSPSISAFIPRPAPIDNGGGGNRR